MTHEDQRAAVVAEAMTWLGTPWMHMARLKGVGVDCANLPIAVYAACGLIEPFEPPPYPRDWHIHMREERIVPVIERFGREIEPADAQTADLLVFKIGHVFSHCALVVRPGKQGIHASVRDRIVSLCDLDRDYDLITPIRRAFTLKGW
jgi:NlpC/P60 family putative phage cell wall peptidase